MQRISTLAELDARLHSLQQAADASSSAGPGRIPMGQLFKLAENFIAASPLTRRQVRVMLRVPRRSRGTGQSKKVKSVPGLPFASA